MHKSVAAQHLSVGQEGERIACRYLASKGYSILTTNYCNPLGRRLGEIDIIAEHDGTIIFVEVKTRIDAGRSTILPEENITRDKLRKIEKIAQHYLRSTHQLDRQYRFDALAILYNSEQRHAKVRHLEHIFY